MEDIPKVLAVVPLKDEQRDALLLDMHAKVAVMAEQLKDLPDHEERIRKLEKRFWAVPPSLLAAIAAMFGIHYS